MEVSGDNATMLLIMGQGEGSTGRKTPEPVRAAPNYEDGTYSFNHFCQKGSRPTRARVLYHGAWCKKSCLDPACVFCRGCAWALFLPVTHDTGMIPTKKHLTQKWLSA